MAKGPTTYVRPEDIDCSWALFDAQDCILGRLAARIAYQLRGKHRADFTPSTCMGDHIVVVNVEKLAVTGRKLDDKIYYRYTGYPGGIKQKNLRKALEDAPEQVLRKAVKGMLPRNRLGRAMLRKLHIYSGNEHPHAAQKPQTCTLNA
ncbi:MAG: 50S ribosomal protein L13 [Gammaproteobacteria bacterium]